MKIQQLTLAGLIAVACCLTACAPSEEDVQPKRRSSRDENLKRYMSKAQELRAQAQLRAKPIVSGPLLTGQDVKAVLPAVAKDTVLTYLQAQHQSLEDAVRAAAAKKAAESTTAVLGALDQEAAQAVSAAPSTQEAAAKLQEFSEKYSQALAKLAEEIKNESWATPSATQSQEARENLQKKEQDLLTQIKEDYGPSCADKVKPVLAKVGDEYWLALSSVKNPEEFNQTLAQISKDADERFEKTLTLYGDPKVDLPEEQAALLRSQLIANHQQTEQQFEKLYGKEAVLKSRAIFETYLKETDQLWTKKQRLSEMTARLEELGAAYRQQITALQVKLNDELEQKTLSLQAQNPAGVIRTEK